MKEIVFITVNEDDINGCACCDMCGETVHSYLYECPLCKEKKYDIITLGHMAWYEIYPELLKEDNWLENKFTCRKCKSEFKYIRKEKIEGDDWENNYIFEVLKDGR